MKNFMLAFGVDLHEVVITDLNEGIFYSKLICSNEKETVEIDSRTSDALALAVRFGCPIYIYDTVMDSAGVSAENEEKKRKEAVPATEMAEVGTADDLSKMNLEELNTLLNEVLDQEDYIRAISIRDEIKKRTK
jgi:bifunctional DNase/RNase